MCETFFKNFKIENKTLPLSSVLTANTQFPRSTLLLTPQNIAANMIIEMKNGSTVADKKNELRRKNFSNSGNRY